MKRKLTIILSTLFTTLLFGCGEAASIGVIGGADGPTAIYTTTKASPTLLLIGGIAALAILVGIGVILYVVTKKRK